MWSKIACVVGLVCLASACSSALPVQTPSQTPERLVSLPTAAPAQTQSSSQARVVIDAAEQYFNPDQVSVGVGTTVVWKDVQGTHDMVADDRSFASAVLFEGQTYSHVFATRGHYRYICTLHVGAGMWAEVNVN
jgi:plastocyanin